jgi:pimeloyl-ACP methyl ester carboxylesterase
MTRSRDGVEIAYETHGESTAPAVLLVHGWAGNRTYWHRQIDILVDRYFVIALDLGGHGESGVGRADWTLKAFGDDVVAVIEDVDPPSVALVGHSMGGDAIVFAATQLGDRVNGLVWVDAFRSLGDEAPASADQVEAFAAPFHADFAGAVDGFVRGMFPSTADPALVDRVAADMAGAPHEAAAGSIACALNRQPPIIDALPRITAPIVAINPDVAPTDLRSLRTHGVASVVMLHDVGHFLMLEDPGQFNPVLAETLASFFE